MQLLNTVNLANALAVHSLNELAVYQNGTVSLYTKNVAANKLDLLQSYTLADVRRLAISDNGKNLCAQTSTQTHRLSQSGAEPLNVTGRIAISDSNYLLVLLSNTVQIVRETTVNLSATLTIEDQVVCGANAYMVYNPTRYLRGTYTGFVLTPTTPTGKTIRRVVHTGNDVFAVFYSDGSVEMSGVTRTNMVLTGHRDCGKHVIANDGAFEYAFMKKNPQSAPIKLRTFIPPALAADYFTVDANGGTAPGFTITKTAGVVVDDPAFIDHASITLPAGNRDVLTVTFNQALNLSVTDWTLEWSSINLAQDEGYIAELAMHPIDNIFGVTARYGDGGFGNRLQFGCSFGSLATTFNANFNKTALNGALKRYALVKQGSIISAYINDVKQNLATGTSTTYDQPTFPVDTDLTAIRLIEIGANATGGATMPAKRGPVKLSLFAKQMPAFTVFSSDGTLNNLITNNGVTVASNLLTFGANKYLSMAGNATMLPGTKDYEVEMEVYFVGWPTAVSGSVLQPLIFWGTWATTGQPVNLDIFYNHTAGAQGLSFNTRYDSGGTHGAKHNVTLELGKWYSLRWSRKSGVLKLYIDNVEVMSTAYAYDISFDTTQPMHIGRRAGGSAGEVVWFANMQMRKLSTKIG